MHAAYSNLGHEIEKAYFCSISILPKPESFARGHHDQSMGRLTTDASDVTETDVAAPRSRGACRLAAVEFDL